MEPGKVMTADGRSWSGISDEGGGGRRYCQIDRVPLGQVQVALRRRSPCRQRARLELVQLRLALCVSLSFFAQIRAHSSFQCIFQIILSEGFRIGS